MAFCIVASVGGQEQSFLRPCSQDLNVADPGTGRVLEFTWACINIFEVEQGTQVAHPHTRRTSWLGGIVLLGPFSELHHRGIIDVLSKAVEQHTTGR